MLKRMKQAGEAAVGSPSRALATSGAAAVGLTVAALFEARKGHVGASLAAGIGAIASGYLAREPLHTLTAGEAVPPIMLRELITNPRTNGVLTEMMLGDTEA